MTLIKRDLTTETLLAVFGFSPLPVAVEIPPCVRVPPAGNMTRQRAIKTPPSNGGAACGVLVCNDVSPFRLIG